MSSSLYDVRKIPGKGRGLVARSDILEGTRILCEKPLLMIPNNMSKEQLEARLARDLKALDKTQQRQFFSLHNSYTGKYVLGGIFKTNSMACGSDSSAIAIFPTISFINHSCLPNSHYNWNDSMGMQTIHVTRDLRAGEEISICYTDSGSASVRQAYLKKHFGFDCSCAICSLSATHRNASDARREEISRLQDTFAEADHAMSQPEEAFFDLRKIVELLNKEFKGAAKVPEADIYCYAVQLSLFHSDEARASVFAERAYKALLICVGEDGENAQEMKALIDNPASDADFGSLSSRWRSNKYDAPRGRDFGKSHFEDWLWHSVERMEKADLSDD
ncbi:uncharacterized protein J4E92_001970 [Alternaria infectoria]|uniref:uncharacterized protein n=1 Tax=Alternaria infectoria TaxID=45303 RepID=UPI0022204C27|nr:uncharacterized protein J4E92_001970 [Alternaria infectoria]KAI4937240.1 hypothetical protein J4E92_001970 [Alternaria infectoria]